MRGLAYILPMMALGLAVLLSLFFWTAEIMFGRHIGVYLGCASILVVTSFTAYAAYAELRHCHLVERAPFPQCEWSPLVLYFLILLALLTVPSLGLSTAMLKKVVSQSK